MLASREIERLERLLDERLRAEGKVSRFDLRPRLYFGAPRIYDAYWRLVSLGDGGPNLDYRNVQEWLDRNADGETDRETCETLFYALYAEHRRIYIENLPK